MGCLLLVSTLSVMAAEQVSKKLTIDDRIGSTQTLVIYPGKVIDSQWAGFENVLSPDLPDYALYQDFTTANAAYVSDESVSFTKAKNLTSDTYSSKENLNDVGSVTAFTEEDFTTNSTSSVADSLSATSSATVNVEAESELSTNIETAGESEVSTETVEIEVPNEAIEESEVPETNNPGNEVETASSTALRKAQKSVFAFFSTVTNLFPFAQSTATSTQEQPVVTEPEGETETDDAVMNDSAADTTTEIVEVTPEVPAETASSSESESEVEQNVETEPGTESDVASTTKPVAPSDEVANTAQETALVSDAQTLERRSLTVGDFSTAELEKGQFVKNIQLRASLAGLPTATASGTAPTLRFVATTPSSTFEVGAVILDEEVSNALNGGHFLFSFPLLKNIKQLKHTEVEVVFEGVIADMDGVYLDALWLEMELETITREDLLQRTNGDRIKHLRSPEHYELLSEQRDFGRNELLSFNLKYSSQRSKMVESVRSFLGRDKVKIKTLQVKHSGAGALGVQPEVTTTKDGLVSIVIPDEERAKMKPGVYVVELTYTEGGKTFTDSFDFQWGLLSINTNQTEYRFTDTATIMAGALTPNGNTLCQADLRLFVIAPNGAVSERAIPATGACNGNNVTDVPDYMTTLSLDQTGEYQLYLERVSETGEVISHTTSNFFVKLATPLTISRNGPTRIYPPAPYDMDLTVTTAVGFVGTITERVPNTFKVSAAGATVKDVDGWLELTWDLSLLAGQSKTVSYNFDAPDLSPFLYEVGPARLVGSTRGTVSAPAVSVTEVSTSTMARATSTPTSLPSSGARTSNIGADFTEHRQWQIASDATGNMILLWDDGASIPTDWSCLSCGSGLFYQSFGVGTSSANYGVTGGSANHSHSFSTSLLTSAVSSVESGSGGPAIVTHTHTLSPSITNGSNLPPYRQLRVIQYTASAGEPATIPAGAIGIFDVASSSLPSGWTRYADQDGYFVRGEDTPGTTGGSATHAHTLSGTTGAASGGTARSRGGGSQTTAATSDHTHSFSTSTANINQEPPYLEVVFAKLGSAAAPPNNLITMWTEDVPSGWLDVSSNSGDDFHNRFIKGASSYGATGGNATHSHVDMNGASTGAPSATINGRSGSSGAGPTHTHDVNLTSFSTTSNLPPFTGVVYGKRQGTDPVYEQRSFRWYVNENNQTPTDAWSTGGVIDLGEGENITATSTPVAPGDELRLRLNAAVTNATSTIGSTFRLEYAAADTCSLVGSWSEVGTAASSTIWRGVDNASVTDGSTISSLLLASSTVAATYEENGVSTTTPNDIAVDELGEWDFVLEHNDAAAGTSYCFRLVESDGTAFATYTSYPQLYTNAAPNSPTHTAPFDNEKTASTTPYFTFNGTDDEGNDVHYQIQIDNDYDFSSTVVDANTVSNAALFTNITLPSDKAPFNDGDLMQFEPASALSNGTTYWWRVRSRDPGGSTEWGAWSTSTSLTIDTALSASAWFQTMEEQFDTNSLDGVESLATDEVQLITGSTTATMTGTAIDFSAGNLGTAWNNLTFADTNNVTYQIEYLTDASSWALIPDSDLANNSTGFTSSPVSLLGLNVETYNTIRVVASFDNGAGTPSLQDWTINWGYRVETPTITKLFPNEKTSTTTPIFEFTTTDPQADDLTYQISWSTDQTFTSSTTRTSTGAGFTNIDDGGDSDPFTSGDTIQFEVAGADALTNGETYWWRVRAKDTTGDNAYSFWTDPQSFTVDTTVVVSTWFQTTSEQFGSNILSGTIAVNDSATVATTAVEALLVYGEGVLNTPRYREWNGSSWSSEDTMLDVGAPLKWAVVEAGTTREEYVAVTVGTDADVNAQVFATGAWGDLQELTTTMGAVTARGFDVAYETLSGDAIVAYCDGDADPSYYVWDGSSWTSGGTINLSSTNDCEWIELEANPTSDEIIILSRDSDGGTTGSYEAQVWNGSSWGNSTTFGRTNESNHAGMALMYEESGGQAVIIASNWKSANFNWNSWNGTTWGSVTTQAIGNDFEWGQLARDEGSDEMILCYLDEDQDVGVVRWTGSGWTGQTELDLSGNAKNDPPFACIFENGGSRDNYIMTALSDTAQTEYSVWDNSSWSANSQINSISDTVTSLLTRTGDDTILGFFFDDVNDALRFADWDGSAWGSTQTLETDMPVDTTPFGRPYDVATRNAGRDGTTIASPGINFTDGVGPYWESFDWNDSQPGSSDITYYVQYYNGDSWEFIPDGDLSGNGAGFTAGPVDLSGLNVGTYDVIRPYAALSCDGSGNCPALQDWTVEWAEGITVSGTLDEYDETTAVNSGTMAVAVNGVLQTGKTGTVSAGSWSINNVTVFAGDVVTVFVDGAATSSEAVGVTRYDGAGDITGMTMYERHLTLGSDDVGVAALTNNSIGLYTNTNDEDVLQDLSGATLQVCAESGCADAELHILPGTTYTPGGNLHTHDFENNGTLIATSTLSVTGSWDDNATSTLTSSLVSFAATSTTETIDTTGALTPAFNDVTFGTTTGNPTFTLASTLDVDGGMTVERGTLARGTQVITIAGDVTTGSNGMWSGVATTTFDGGTAASWSDASAGANIGLALVEGNNKVVTLGSDVTAQTLTIGADDTLDASVSGYTLTLYGNFNNNNVFQARTGTVAMAATSSGVTLTTNSSDFYDLTFNGVGGSYSFTEGAVTVGNDLTIATGTVTLATSTTTIGGSFLNTGGDFAHNNATVLFDGTGSEVITLAGDIFTNSLYNTHFNGSGSWSFSESYATSSHDVQVISGTVTFPGTELAVGGSLVNTTGTLIAGTSSLRMYTTDSESLTLAGETIHSLAMTGSGTLTLTDTSATLSGDLLTSSGTTMLPTSNLAIGGSLTNTATLTPGTGTVTFNSTDTGETISLGGADLYDVTINSASGGWTLVSATTTNNFSLTAASDFTLGAGETLAVAGDFANTVGGASTTWTGSTLALTGGNYTINAKTDAGDSYDTVLLDGAVQVSVWNSDVSSLTSGSASAWYSQDDSGTDGALLIYGDYTRTSGAEYWSYATDFDGTDLTGSERVAAVSLADGSTVTITDSTFAALGGSAASTTVSNQGSGTYTIAVSGGTTTAQYYEFTDLGTTGLSLVDSTVVSTLDNGAYTVAAAGGSALTVASSTIDSNPALQIFNTTFATTTLIAATNVTQTGGTPGSYWWFRNGVGNLYGEQFDADTGDPGSVRFDDSSLVISVSGTVYADDGTTPLTVTTCNGLTNVVRLVVSGGATYDTSCSGVDGSFNLNGVVVVGDPTLTLFLNNASGGQQATLVTKTPTSNISDADLYTNRVIVRHEDVEPLTIADMVYDNTDDSDVRFTAATTSPVSLQTQYDTELFVWASSTFTPGGTVTLNANATGNSYDGTLVLDDGATFAGAGTTTYTIGGSLIQGTGATFTAASSTVIFNATTTGKAITASGGDTIAFHELSFTGSGGAWNINTDLTIASDMNVVDGTVTGTNDLTLTGGSLTGNGLVSLGGGTVLLETGNTLGGTQGWTFNNLTLGNGSEVGTTTPSSSATTTVAGVLTIANAHFFDMGSLSLDLTGTGSVLVETGTILEDMSTIRYRGAGADVLATGYYNLSLDSESGSQTYTATGIGTTVANDLTVGGTAATTFDVTTNDTVLAVTGDVLILSNGTLEASDSAALTVNGSWDNNGVFVSNSGEVTFAGSGTHTIAAGASDFAAVTIDGSGDFTVSEHATATDAFALNTAGSFTLTSGQTLAVGDDFSNNVGGADTTWTGSTLFLYGGGNYTINPATTTDSYATLLVGDDTHIRAWNSDASTVTTGTGASLYSMDHSDVPGDLYIYGDYTNTATTDYWSYETDFDGSALGGSARAVDVYIENAGSVTYTDSSQLSVLGISTASTTIQNQGSGTYSLTIGGSASTTFNYYDIADFDSAGLTFSGSAVVQDLSYGLFTVANDSDSAITVGGTAINASPARNFTHNNFTALGGVSSAFNVTATGTSVSSWRFTNHTGNLDGENNDSDPDGDPGYIVWDDSAATITVSGTVYTNEGSGTPGAGVCDGSTNTVRIVVAGLTTYDTTCGNGTGVFSVSGINYSPGDSVIAYLLAVSGVEGATVTVAPVSNINDFDIYLDRVIVRHESTVPITIADLATYDSSDDANIPFTATTGSPDALTLPVDRKLIVWNSKEFAPDGDVTLTAGGSQSYGGALQLYSNAQYTAAAGEVFSVGGSLLSDAGASFVASTGTTTFTTTGAGRTIDINDGSFYNVAFTGSGSWSVTDSLLDVNDFNQSAGTLTLPTGTTTVSGSFIASGGSFAENGNFIFDGAGTETITLSGSDIGPVTFTGSGSWSFTDTNATSTGGVQIESGSVTLPSGTLALSNSFDNTGGSFTHNSGLVRIENAGNISITASSSDMYSVTLTGGGNYTFTDTSIALLGDLSILSGNATLAATTTSIGGSFTASAATFDNATGTVLFNSTDTGETITPGSSSFYNVVFGSATGGWTITDSATTTNNFSLTTASDFTLQSGATLVVQGVFNNDVGGVATTWSGSTLVLDSGSSYEVNDKSVSDDYQTLTIGANSDISLWNSVATTTNVAVTSSLYSQDHAAVDGALNIYGDYHVSTTTEYWSYATDFDGASLSGSERAVTVAMAAGATTTIDGGTVQMVGVSGNETTVTNQGAGTYALAVTEGTLNAQYFAVRNINGDGLYLSGTPTISSLTAGDFEVTVADGAAISLASTTLNANASLVIANARFATTTAISATNVTLSGVTSNAWTFVSHTGNLAGEAFDVDGGTQCGSIRWDDSSCLLTQQTNYRWRHDDGGVGAPDTQWYNASWNKRQSVRVENNDASTYTDAVVELKVAYDSDMQSDFDDLRFTDNSGTTTLSHFIASTTNGVAAEVWVKVPTLTASDDTFLYMYYGNAVATSTASSTTTFVVADDFEDNNISEYSGDTTLFNVGSSEVYGGSYSLDNAGNTTERATDGMFDTSVTVQEGQIIQYQQYVDTSVGDDEVCTLFAVQSPGTNNENYAICTEQIIGPGDYLTLSRDIVDTDVYSGVSLASTSVSFETGWYQIEIDWQTDGTMDVTLEKDGSEVATLSASDPLDSYSSGGIGFTYWINRGAWDNYTVRTRVATEPTVYFGAEQDDGGASWAANLNTAANNFSPADVARLRVLVENSGLTVSGQTYQLEYAAQGVAPSCEAVSAASFAVVPPQASCDTSPVCMQTSGFVTNGESIADLLQAGSGDYTLGEATESPDNTADAITLNQNTYTELEYVITPTSDVVDQNLCFRVSNSGTDLDTYLRVAKMSVRFDPVFGAVTFNNGADISLLPGATTTVYATGTVTDLNGYNDLTVATSTMYSSAVGAACAADNNNCYIETTAASCSFTDCAGNSCTLSCQSDFYYHADPTDESGGDWYAFLEVEDAAGGYDFATSPAIDLLTLRALDVTNSIDYASVAPQSDTGAQNATSSIQNQGNDAIDVLLAGTDLSDGYNSTIPVTQQKFATSTFTYDSCVSCGTLGTTTTTFEVDLTKPTVAAPPVTDDIYWGIAVPFGVSSAPHTGQNTFYATDD